MTHESQGEGLTVGVPPWSVPAARDHSQGPSSVIAFSIINDS